jgi:hypothetical protein
MADYYVVRGERGFGVRRDVGYTWAAIIAVVASILHVCQLTRKGISNHDYR